MYTKFGEFGLRGRTMRQPTNFAARLHGWDINDSTNFLTLYSLAPTEPLVHKFGRNELYQIYRIHRSISAAPKNVLDFRYLVMFSNEGDSEVKTEDRFRTFWQPVKLGAGWAKCLSQFFNFSPKPILWYTFDRGSLHFWEVKSV